MSGKAPCRRVQYPTSSPADHQVSAIATWENQRITGMRKCLCRQAWRKTRTVRIAGKAKVIAIATGNGGRGTRVAA